MLVTIVKTFDPIIGRRIACQKMLKQVQHDKVGWYVVGRNLKLCFESLPPSLKLWRTGSMTI
ncbi:hypothetical protein A2533_04345 [Candidatus Falkowbacteria bacterium RIFOXYD2_FULL_35_9]|uniref:Uncharacterized protein n=1 Tax=Candidatus Falkowbacteria bacterium RIFOXYC2_FULL_36_12 TaxID=1798002 RepID=A0A1F5T3J7_9BACT|nr:MAG: hypothetical protein A2300_03865 [Candidatus Falkowbacteria bacterium RIFOXYB2_FULL_35_7]OGF33525.1 MAG: hypothetical protein A2478_02485 [Candidatus Falkowbacteria bacterium RIFOXYC2_FULL_36_12]OGF34195.1 MAG: hypothetical protein A2223_01180 [Candidatus Falkowbacteria bacterium RIFOXYA2_FULL_35_8]OGF45700.1 MAG: hypothetical protein A2533_04345 [Candidatus Falkowbacteria bacterium RIFOXYD2_FULL_35_9]